MWLIPHFRKSSYGLNVKNEQEIRDPGERDTISRLGWWLLVGGAMERTELEDI